MTNDAQALQILADRAFDPQQQVLVAAPDLPPPTASTNSSPGTVSITEYHPKRVVLNAQVSAPAILLLNDKFDPNWRVSVDGAPQPLLRANFIMRGVALSPGTHVVEFRFKPPHWTLYLSLASIAGALVLCGFVFVQLRPPSAAATEESKAPVAADGMRKP